MVHLEFVTMTGALVVFVSLGVLQALWGSAFSLPSSAQEAAPEIVDEVADLENNEYCHSCIKIDNYCYNHTYLFQLNAPFGEYPVVKKMGIMKSNNVLYYTFEPKLNDPEYSKVGYVSLDSSKYFGVISGWQSFNFGAFDINQKEKKVYLGGSDGIWVINSTNPVPTFLAEKQQSITNIVSKDYVYYTKKYSPGIVRIVNGNYDYLVKNETIDNFVLDKPVNFNVVYLSDTGLYISFNSKSQKEPVRLSTERFIRGLTVDARGTVYAWHVDGIYKVVLGNVLSEATLKSVSGLIPDAMAFDKDNNIVYAMRKRLFKLTKVLTRNCNSA